MQAACQEHSRTDHGGWSSPPRTSASPGLMPDSPRGKLPHFVEPCFGDGWSGCPVCSVAMEKVSFHGSLLTRLRGYDAELDL